MRRWLPFFLFSVVTAAMPARADGFDHAHEAWTRVLRTHVNEGRVAYTALHAGDGGKALDAYLTTVGAVTPAQYAAFTSPQKLAFWINAYNATCIKNFVSRMPLRSVQGTGLNPPDGNRVKVAVKVEGGESVSLADVEQKILPRFKDPRAWLALTCGARGHPPLKGTAYRADVLDSQLDDAAQRFISDPARNRVDAGARTLRLATVFQWHRREMEAVGGPLPGVVAPYLDADGYEMARKYGAGVKVVFEPFEWDPNGY
ncbi:MAG: DUF547 domain-containing protein [Deltaproteobacteria bacterium]|nr:DUF547 domain-containing protein [Deltaproteobacteria bacterium]